MKDQHAKEIEVLKDKHRQMVEDLEVEVKRLVNKVAEGGDNRKVSILEAEIRELKQKQETDREKHVEELTRLRAESADNIKHLERIQALEVCLFFSAPLFTRTLFQCWSGRCDYAERS